MIKQPQNTPNLKFDIGFAAKWNKRFEAVQKFVDSEVLRRVEPYVPLRTGTMIRTGILGTKVGSGAVKWIAPYSSNQYYRGRKPGASKSGPLRGRFWFERWKEADGGGLIADAKKMAGRAK